MDNIRNQVRELCRFPNNADFTLKWVDDEQDLCMLTSERELNEAIRLFRLNKDYILTVVGRFLYIIFYYLLHLFLLTFCLKF